MLWAFAELCKREPQMMEYMSASIQLVCEATALVFQSRPRSAWKFPVLVSALVSLSKLPFITESNRDWSHQLVMRVAKELALSENDARPQQRVPLVQAFDAFRISYPEARRDKTKFVVVLKSAEASVFSLPGVSVNVLGGEFHQPHLPGLLYVRRPRLCLQPRNSGLAGSRHVHSAFLPCRFQAGSVEASGALCRSGQRPENRDQLIKGSCPVLPVASVPAWGGQAFAPGSPLGRSCRVRDILLCVCDQRSTMSVFL